MATACPGGHPRCPGDGRRFVIGGNRTPHTVAGWQAALLCGLSSVATLQP